VGRSFTPTGVSHLEALRERGVLRRERNPEDGRAVLWVDNELHRVNEHGDVELDPITLDELNEDEVRQVARSSIYTWNLTNLADAYAERDADTDTTVVAGGDTAPTDGCRPPRPPE